MYHKYHFCLVMTESVNYWFLDDTQEGDACIRQHIAFLWLSKYFFSVLTPFWPFFQFKWCFIGSFYLVRCSYLIIETWNGYTSSTFDCVFMHYSAWLIHIFSFLFYYFLREALSFFQYFEGLGSRGVCKVSDGYIWLHSSF